MTRSGQLRTARPDLSVEGVAHEHTPTLPRHRVRNHPAGAPHPACGVMGIPSRTTVEDWHDLFTAAYGHPIGDEPVAATTDELNRFWRNQHGIDRPHPTVAGEARLCLFNHPVVEIQTWPSWMP